MICVYKLKVKKSKIKNFKNRRVTGWYQRLWYNFFARGNFLYLNQSFSLSMSKFLHLLFIVL